MTTSIIEEVIKPTLCKHCDVSYPTTKDFFYMDRGRLSTHICKECKKIKSKDIQKNKDIRVRDRRQYFKDRRLKIKLEKEALNRTEN